MSSIRFANVLLETKPRALSYPTMYYHTDQLMHPGRTKGEWVIAGEGTVDFTTYFNALSVLKLRRYTRATGFTLHLEARSKAPALVMQTVADRLATEPQPVPFVNETVPGDGKWHQLALKLDVDEHAVLAGFRIETGAETSIRDGWYEVEYEGEANPVELAIATTTFRKERFIERNIELVRTELLQSDDDIAQHLTMHVVDNGSTLDAAALSDGRITVSPNENVGGAGGFARGMIESLEQAVPATNVLLMDDDVEVSPESIRRTYNLLRIVNDEYRDAFVSGAMLNMEDVQDMKEDTGFISPTEGSCVPAKPPLQVTKFLDAVYNECYSEEEVIPADAHRYAAWWYCCIPASTIRREGMPLPIFVRYDDVEYGIRCNPKFMTMNGLCVWHAKFEIRYNAGVERYQTVRNSCIGQAVTGLAPSMDTMLTGMRKMVNLELRKFNYTDAELALAGFEDFLKGPRFIEEPVVQEKFMWANRAKEQMVDFATLTVQLEEMGIHDFDPDTLTRQRIDLNLPRSMRQRAYDYLTANGQRVALLEQKTADESQPEDFGLINHQGWEYQAGSIHGQDVIVSIDWSTRKGVVRTKDTDRYRGVLKRMRRDLAYWRKHEQELMDAWQQAAPMLKSVPFWKRYLHMD